MQRKRSAALLSFAFAIALFDELVKKYKEKNE